MEVNIKTKYEMLALQCMHDNLLKSTKKVQGKYDLGSKLCGGQGQGHNKIAGAHLPHVGSAMHA